jgi:hypothetical protein
LRLDRATEFLRMRIAQEKQVRDRQSTASSPSGRKR